MGSRWGFGGDGTTAAGELIIAIIHLLGLAPAGCGAAPDKPA
jgi:hypothetical protein